MSRVILVNPQVCSLEAVRLPLSLLALGAVLEGRHEYEIVDGNLDPQATERVLQSLAAAGRQAAVGVSVMPGPQVAPAIALSQAIRRRFPQVPIVWGGYFPTLYSDAALNAGYVDYLVRGQGESTLLELLERLDDPDPAESALAEVAGLSFKAEGRIRHNPDRPFRPPEEYPPLPYRRLPDAGRYLRRSFLGRRTGAYQVAIGCRYRCSFCGVVSMFDGTTHLGSAERMAAELREQRDRYGADSMQFVDHNFFDTEAASRPVLEQLAELALPWWCYARADVLVGLSAATWELIRRSRLRMAYIGAEAASDEALRRMRKGTRVEQTLEVTRLCRAHGVIPELSFILGGPEDPDGQMEETFGFVRKLKRLHPDCEVVLYFYSPTPQRGRPGGADGESGARLPVLERYGPDGPELPATPEEWAEPRWVDYVCHRDAPWLTPRLRRRVRDFATVLGCRFPTVQDHAAPEWGRAMLRGLAGWRYRSGIYGHPWELRAARRAIRLREPSRDSV